MSTSTDFGPIQTDTERHGALVSRKTSLGPTRQAHTDVVNRQTLNIWAPCIQTQADTDRRGAE